MRRCMWLIVVACVLGIVLNVAVTWTIVVRQIGTTGTSFTKSSTMGATPWAVPVPEGWPAESTQTDVMRWACYESRLQLAAEQTGTAITFYAVERRSFGWPMVSMSSYHGDRVESVPGRPQTHNVVDLPGVTIGGGWVLRNRRDLPDVLPMVPLPLGFSINSALYGLLVLVVIVLFVLVFKPFRRAQWRAKGLCGGCGYEIGDLAECPECGAGA